MSRNDCPLDLPLRCKLFSEKKMNFLKLASTLIIMIMLLPPVLAAEEIVNPVDMLIDQSGLGHLSESDREKLRGLIKSIASTSSKISSRQARLAALAEKYFSAQGYKLLYLQLVEVQGKSWLVVADTFGKSATSDLPLMFPRNTFEDGFYFCQSGLMGGISKMLDEDGREHSFLLSNWKNFR